MTRRKSTPTSPHDEMIIAIELPPRGFRSQLHLSEDQGSLSYAFALVSVAVGLELEGGAIGSADRAWRGRA